MLDRQKLEVFRERVRAVARQKGVTQGQMAGAVGVSRRTIARMLAKGSTMAPTSLQSIALGDLLGVSTRYIWGLSDRQDYPEYPSEDERTLLRAFRALDAEAQRDILVVMTEGQKAIAKAMKRTKV